MTLAELIHEYERRGAEARKHGSRAPLDKVYSLIIDELQTLDGATTVHRMMNTREAAQTLGVAPKTIAKWAGEGRFPNARKTSDTKGNWLIPASDIYATGGDKRLRTTSLLWEAS